MGRRRSSSSVSTLQIMAVVIVVLAVGITLAFIYAPKKPAAPPTSTILYGEHPAKKPVRQLARDDYEELPSPAPRRQKIVPAADSTPAPPPEPEAPYRIIVSIVDMKTGEPLSNARIYVTRDVLDEEVSDLRNQVRDAIRARDMKKAEALEEQENEFYQKRHAKTGEDGRATVPLRMTGTFTVEVLAEGYIPAKQTGVVVDEQNPEQNVGMSLSGGATVSGRVTESGSTVGAAGVRVMLDIGDINSQQLLMSFRGHWPLTDEEGNYIIKGLPVGNFGITVDTSNSPYKPGKILPYQKVRITQPSQEITGVNFSVDAAGIVWGYVTDMEKKPIQRADMLLCTSESIFSQALNSAIRRAPPIQGHSEEDGYYELVGVPLNEEWRVYATSDTYSPQLADPFMLTSAQRSVRIDVFMFGGTTVYGRVVTDKGEPIPNADVMCIPSYSQILSPLESPQAFRESHSDENGNFVIDQLPAGSYQVFGGKKGYKFAASGEPIYPNGYSPINNVQVVLYPVDTGEYSVFGTVRDIMQNPISGAHVVLEGLSTASFEDINMQTDTDGSGGYRFDAVTTGMYRITVTKDGYAPQTVHRVLFNLATDVVLETSAVVRGMVLVKETGRAPEITATVTPKTFSIAGQGIISFDALTGESTQNRGVETQADGRFELLLSSGQYELEARTNQHTPGRTPITLEAGQVLEGVKIYISAKGGTVEGKVVTSDGKSPQGALVVLVEGASSVEGSIAAALGGEGGNSMRVGEDGVFTFTNRPAGPFSLVAQHASYAAANSGPLEMSDGGNVRGIVLRLGSGGAIEGTVYINGQIAANAVVMISGPGSTKTTNTDDKGHYYVDGLSTGTYQLVVSPVGSGDISGVFDTRSVSVDVVEGRTTRYDFGAAGGVRVEGRCSPSPQVGGAVVFRPPSPQVIGLGETAQLDQLVGGNSAMINPLGGNFIVEDVQPGEWQVDVFYFQFGAGVRYVHTELVTITGEQAVVPLDLNIQM